MDSPMAGPLQWYNKHMNQLFQALLALSFAIGFAIGFFTKRYIFLILSVLAGAGIAALSVAFYLAYPHADVGLGIIALFPVLVVMLGAFNIGAALVGGIIGTMIGKQRRK